MLAAEDCIDSMELIGKQRMKRIERNNKRQEQDHKRGTDERDSTAKKKNYANTPRSAQNHSRTQTHTHKHTYENILIDIIF